MLRAVDLARLEGLAVAVLVIAVCMHILRALESVQQIAAQRLVEVGPQPAQHFIQDRRWACAFGRCLFLDRQIVRAVRRDNIVDIGRAR